MLFLHASRLTRHRVRCLLSYEPICLGPRRIRSCALHHDASRRHHLVCHFRAAECRGFLARIQASRHRTTCPHKPDSPSNSTCRRLPAPSTFHGSGWCPSLWRHLRRTLLHHELNLVLQGLLHVRFPLHLLRTHDYHFCGCHGIDDLLLTLRRELPLAMALFLHRRCKCRVCLC